MLPIPLIMSTSTHATESFGTTIEKKNAEFLENLLPALHIHVYRKQWKAQYDEEKILSQKTTRAYRNSLVSATEVPWIPPNDEGIRDVKR